MFFFFHLFTGIVLGLLIADLLQDRRWVIPFIIGSVLPDLIDKPVGYILFGDTIGSGRIYTHGLLLCAIILLAGLLLWRFRSNPAGIALATGVFLHQILDLMWQDPVTWYYPLAGPLKTRSVEDYAFTLLKTDLASWSEWIVIASVGAGVLVYLLVQRKIAVNAAYRNMYEGLLAALALIFCILSGIAIGFGLEPVKKVIKIITPYVGWSRPEEFILAGIIFALCAYYIWRLRSDLLAAERDEKDFYRVNRD
jgi:hypothetical protein